MASVLRLLTLLGVNAVPGIGIFLGGWSSGTALALYWWENFFGSILIAIRVAVHRRLTHKRGHYVNQVTVRTTISKGRKRVERTDGRSTFLSGFVTTMLVFTGAHGIFLA